MVSIQSSYTFPSKCRCSPTFGNLMSCSSLTSYFYSLNCFSCGHAICGTSFLYSLNYVSCGVVICGTSIVCMAACTIVGTTECSIFPLIIFYALTFVLSCSVFTPLCKVLPSSTLFFLLRTLLGEYVVAFFLFSNVVYISSLVLLTLVGGLCGFSFWCTNEYRKIFANTKVDWLVSFLSPLFSFTYLYHQFSSLHKLLNIICAQSTFFPFFVLINVITFMLLKYWTFSFW